MANVIVGVTGGIAAYKAAELVSLLGKQGHAVRCIMTEAAQQFITPLTLQTLSGNPVYTDMFQLQENPEWQVEHIGLARWADCILIVPATADFIGKVAHGLADDLLSTCVMASAAPVIFAPAMNDQMYANPIVQRNLSVLKEAGYGFVDPVDGNLACGTSGKGKMASPQQIAAVLETLREQDMKGVRLVVTAGPTREVIDPVRFLTNHSSGKMGYAIARQAANRGADVVLVSGPSSQPVPPNVQMVPVESARDMFEAVKEQYGSADIVIKAAAVADYRPKTTATQKIKKSDGDMVLELERNPDILAWLGEHKENQILMGFAAETNDVQQYALGKLQRKHLDFIAANDVTQQHSGFGKDTNQITVYGADGSVHELPVLAKEEAADRLLDLVLETYRNRNNQ
ncbi:MAG: bifunctional phosphopantothenoylcysteine decarboxylase/phosphopantothenate--cysteine ligase CoaBC [Peptococcaceae bacterium]|nr:bifunctional phosphopantothenoylcysteine decarboxylase/phosphopantothenate--cysteine ligase CoaBC [Peptococcaceae bacterium]